MIKEPALCVVCKKPVPEPASIVHEWEARIYPLCSEKCRQEFILDPEMYLHEDEGNDE